MYLLKKENWWSWLLFFVVSGGASYYFLGALLKVYDKKSWYGKLVSKVPKWLLVIIAILVIGFGGVQTYYSYFGSTDIDTIVNADINIFVLLLSLLVMVAVVLYGIFNIQILATVNAKLGVKGKELYMSPYIWIIMIIIPILGWIALVIMMIYLEIAPLVYLYKGKGEKYIK